MECFGLAQSPLRRSAAAAPRRPPASPAADSAGADGPGLTNASAPVAAPQRSTAARRAARPASAGIPILYKVVGLLALVIGIGLAVGYAPLMRWWYTRILDNAPTVQERREAALALVA